jgi:hypothetical protein
MKKIFFVLLASVHVMAFGQTSETRAVDAFTGIRTSALVEVILKSGSPCAVVVEGEADGVKSVTTEVKDGQLVISQSGNSKSGPVKVFVTVSELKSIDLGGAAQLESEVAAHVTDSLKITGAGGSQMELKVTAAKVRVDLSGASHLKLCGTTNELDADVSGAADLRSGCLESKKVTVRASGASKASVSASEKVTARASGAADIVVFGDAADRTVDATGAANIETKSGSGAADTTRVRIGNRNIDIAKDPDEKSDREKKAEDSDFEFWDGMDLGVNGLMTYDNKFTMPAGLEHMELNYVKSYVFGWNMWQKNIHIYRNNVNLGTGIGLSWYHYNLRGSYSLQPNVNYTFAIADSLNYSKNRLNACYVNVPLFLEFNTNNSDADKSFHFAAGAQFGYNVFKNKLKQKYEFDGETYKRKIKDDFNVNPFKIDLITRIGYGDFTIFGTYSLTTLFEKGKGPSLYPFTAGISLDF